MDDALRKAWTEIVTPDDYEQHMAAIGQAQAAAELTQFLIQSSGLPDGASVVIAGAGTGQMLDFLDPSILHSFRLTCTDLNRGYLDRLEQRLKRAHLLAELIVDDFENTSLGCGSNLLLATLLMEHIDWRRGVDTIANLQPRQAGIILQENPDGMVSAVTPGRTVPPSIERALRSAHANLVPRSQLTASLAGRGFLQKASALRQVADGKQLAALLFANAVVA